MATKKKAANTAVEGGNILEKLAALNDAWASVEGKGGFIDLPDDKYIVKIDKATINESKSSGRLQVSFDLIVIEGPFTNRRIWKHDGLNTEMSLSYFKNSLEALGVDTAFSFEDLPDLIAEVVGECVEITLKTKGEQQNCYFNELVDENTVDAPKEPAAPAKASKPSKTAPVEEAPAKKSKKAPAAPALAEGNAVEVLHPDGNVYDATVATEYDDGTFDVTFEDGEVLNYPAAEIKKV